MIFTFLTCFVVLWLKLGLLVTANTCAFENVLLFKLNNNEK